MSLKHWLWIWAGLLVWAALMVTWATGPYDCTAPDAQTYQVTCK